MAIYNGSDAGEVLVGTASDDEFHSSKGQDIFSGVEGYDKAIIDYSQSGGAGQFLGHTIMWMYDNLYGSFRGLGQYIGTETVGIEDIEFRAGEASDNFYVDLTRVPDVWRVSLDAGGGTGFDTIVLKLPNSVTLTGSVTGGVLSAGNLILSNFEQFDLTLASGNDNITLAAGNDVVSAGLGNDIVNGGAGNDTLEGGWGGDRLDGGDGDDRLYADASYGGMDSGTEIDILAGGAGNDLLSIGYGDSADGGSGTDRLSLSLRTGTSGVNLDLSTVFAGATILVGGGTITGFEAYDTIYGTDFADTIATGDAPNGGTLFQSGIFGYAGNDSITTGSRQDTIGGGAGDDVIRSGGDVDRISADEGSDQVFGEEGNDIIYGGSGADVLDGGNGNDFINGGDGGISQDGADLVHGGEGDDRLEGDIGDDRLFGDGGADTLIGGHGTDELSGGEGGDIYIVGVGDVVIETGSSGTDEVRTDAASYSIETASGIENLTGLNFVDQTLTGNSSANLINGGGGIDLMIGGAGNDTYLVGESGDRIVELAGGGIDQVHAGITHALDDEVEDLFLVGFSNVDGIGNALDNHIVGNFASNALEGGTGNDILDGGEGNDILYGGAGADELRGGGGSDLFFYLRAADSAGASVDTIQAFQSGVDLIDVSQVLAGSVSFAVSGNITVVTVRTVYGDMTINVEGTVLAADVVLTAGLIFGTAGDDQLQGTSEGDVLFGDTGADTMTGGLGDDYYLVDNPGDQVVEAAGAGTDGVESIISYVLGPNVEDLVLGGTAAIDGTGNPLDNFMAGNDSANRLDGGGGNDTLFGAGGIDTLVGGAGNDLYLINDGDLVVEISAADGYDVVESLVTHTLSPFVDELRLTGQDAIAGTGNEQANLIVGNGAANLIDGGPGGGDMLRGGLGNDIYVVDHSTDTVSELFGEGLDTVRSSVTRTLDSNVENLTLIGAAAINGTGNDLDNLILGNSAGNVLDGGAGVDTMRGGAGDDTYLLDQYDNAVVEAAGEGVDTISTPWDHELGANIENLTFTGVGVVTGIGNALDNRLTGNSNWNFLDGRAGSDTMIGGLGNDTYFVDILGDTIVELAGEGEDTVQSAVTFTLSENLENLTLTGTAAIDGTGNASANRILGNAGDNVLDGGAGMDFMEGGLGNDTYFVDSNGETVNELPGGGIDTVVSTVTYFLGLDVENLTLSGTGAISGYGNDDANIITGNAAANLLNGFGGDDILRGGAGNDTYDIDDSGDTIVELANQGTDSVSSSASYVLGANVENLTLTGFLDSNGTGNALNNSLTGNGSDNVLDGGLGADIMAGGYGADTYLVDNANDAIVEIGDSQLDLDTVRSSVSYVLGARLENLVLTGTASINGTGNAAVNFLTGNAGANRLDGGFGWDEMAGGAGNDTYVVDNEGDTVTESVGGGSDTVETGLNYALSANVENLVLLAGALAGTGNGLANSLTGNASANTLDGKGGADNMVGGLGDDIYIVDNVGDLVTEATSAGADSVQSSVSFTLGANVENLILLAGALNGAGNALANTITGNGANNLLNGMGGADAMAGGAGHDTYHVDNGGDVVTEAASAGNDTVLASTTFTLGDNVEHLTLTGTGSISGTGNALNNVINGNSAANFLNGGIGADFMTGGGGDDTYFVDNASDKVTEAAGGGTDTVNSMVNYTLGAEVERLVLGGTASLQAIGNDLANIITGNAAANILNGGIGADTMQGGLGNDTYIVDNVGDVTTDTGGVDTVQSSVTVTLHASIDNLLLTGAAAVNGTGNGLWNVMTGNSAANTLDGGIGNDVLNGGLSADTMIGGAGHDTYHVDNVGDQVTDTGGGNDHVHASIDYVLGTDLEYLTLTGSAVSATGNAKNNLLYGNAGNNVIDGLLGADFMVGGLGDDTYYVENGSDQITEHLNQGTDTVMSTVHHALRGNIENLTLIGTNAVSATGNELANVITGNSAANALRGGLGADTLSGGGGNDSFVYRATNESTSASKDQISGFNAGDKVNLSVIDSIAATTANNDAFTFIGANAFSSTAGELRATETGGVWTIEADVNGDGVADLVIGLTTESGYIIGAADFVL
jgi:Ca2+-binding RTX toxin-like protein